MSELLLDEPLVAIQPSLVRRVGILEAAITQQLHYWLRRATREHDGHTWVFKTYSDWANEIGVTPKACRGALDRLRREGIVVAIQNPEDPHDRTLWWRIDHEVLHEPPASTELPVGADRDDPEGAPSAPPGSSYARVPGEAETTQEIQEERASELFDSDSTLPPKLSAVMAILRDVATVKKCNRAKSESVVKVMQEFPDLDHEAVARDLAFWAVHGGGGRKTIKSIAGTYRTFVKRAAGDASANRGTMNGHRRGGNDNHDILRELKIASGELEPDA